MGSILRWFELRTRALITQRVQVSAVVPFKAQVYAIYLHGSFGKSRISTCEVSPRPEGFKWLRSTFLGLKGHYPACGLYAWTTMKLGAFAKAPSTTIAYT